MQEWDKCYISIQLYSKYFFMNLESIQFKILEFLSLGLDIHRFYHTPLYELHVRLTAFVDVSMIIKNANVYIYFTGSKDIKVHIYIDAHTKTHKSYSWRWGMGWTYCMLSFSSTTRFLYLLQYYINRINSTPLVHPNHNQKRR